MSLFKDDEGAAGLFLAWEKLRVPYNLVLVATTLVFGNEHRGDPRFWRMLILYAVIANLFFCAGVPAEGYLRLVRTPRSLARLLPFILGTLLAVGLTIVVVLFYTPSPFR